MQTRGGEGDAELKGLIWTGQLLTRPVPQLRTRTTLLHAFIHCFAGTLAEWSIVPVVMYRASAHETFL